jgi:hypothetical protein
MWKEGLFILKNASYDGTISPEVFDPNDIRGSLAKDVANIRQIASVFDSTFEGKGAAK